MNGDTDELACRIAQLEQKIQMLEINNASGNDSGISLPSECPAIPQLWGGDGNPGCFEIDISPSGQSTYSMSFTNQYYCVAGKTYSANVSSITGSSGIVALKLDVSSSVPGPTIELYAGLAALQSAQGDQNKYIIPLYTVADGEVTCDWRKGALAAMWEF